MHIEFRTKDETIRSQIDAFLKEWPRSDHILVNTSGSTGSPKIISIKKEHAIASARKTLDFLELKEGNSALLCLSPESIAGKMMLIRSLVGNLNLIVTDVSSQPLNCISESETIDFAAMVPLQVNHLLSAEKVKLQNIRKLIIGGASISVKLEKEIVDSGVNAFQTFGMTETISHIALRKLGSEVYFTALPNTTFYIGEDQNLIINSPDIGVNNLETNDIVELINENTFKWIGRKDNVINTGGVKVFPEQIEAKIKTPQNIFISSIPDDVLGNMVILCVEGNTFDKSLIKNLSRYERPKYIFYFNAFNYTNSSKISRLETMNRISDARKQIL